MQERILVCRGFPSAEANLDAGDDGLWQDAFQDLHGFRVLSEHPLHDGLHPCSIRLDPQVGFDARQQLTPLHWLTAHTHTRTHTQVASHVKSWPASLACWHACTNTQTHTHRYSLSADRGPCGFPHTHTASRALLCISFPCVRIDRHTHTHTHRTTRTRNMRIYICLH